MTTTTRCRGRQSECVQLLSNNSDLLARERRRERERALSERTCEQHKSNKLALHTQFSIYNKTTTTAMTAATAAATVAAAAAKQKKVTKRWA